MYSIAVLNELMAEVKAYKKEQNVEQIAEFNKNAFKENQVLKKVKEKEKKQKKSKRIGKKKKKKQKKSRRKRKRRKRRKETEQNLSKLVPRQQ